MYVDAKPGPHARLWQHLGQLARVAVHGVAAYRQQEEAAAMADEAIASMSGVQQPVEAFEFDDGFGEPSDEDHSAPEIAPTPGKRCKPCEKRKQALLAAARRYRGE